MRHKFLGLLMLAMTACAPTATQTTTSAPTPAASSAWFEGQWSAAGVQLNLTRGEDNVIGTLVRLNLQCAANLKVLTQQNDQLIVRQDLLYGGGNCLADQLVVIRKTSGQMSLNFGNGESDLPLTRSTAAGTSLLKAGVYNAVAVQRNPAASYALQLVVSQTAQGAQVSVIYPDQGCASRLKFERIEGNAARFTEQVEHGTCVSGGTIRLDIQAGTGNLHYRWSKDQVPATVEAFMRPGALPRR